MIQLPLLFQSYSVLGICLHVCKTPITPAEIVPRSLMITSLAEHVAQLRAPC